MELRCFYEIEEKFKLSKYQMMKLDSAHKKGTDFTLTLSNKKISKKGIPLPLTASQINMLQDGKPHKITISKDEIKRK